MSDNARDSCFIKENSSTDCRKITDRIKKNHRRTA